MKKSNCVHAVQPLECKIVRVSEETHARLGDYGKKKESYGRIVSRLLDTVEMYQEKYGELTTDQIVINKIN